MTVYPKGSNYNVWYIELMAHLQIEVSVKNFIDNHNCCGLHRAIFLWTDIKKDKTKI